MKKYLTSFFAALLPLTSILQAAPDEKEIFVEAQSAKLFCRILGEGKPLIVLHGGPGLSQEYLLPSMNRLAEHNKVIFYDQRNSGRSEGTSIELNNFLEDIEAIRKQFGFEKVSLLGHSWGGFLAMNYAVKYPDSVDRLILVNSMGATSDDMTLFMQEWGRRMAPYMKEFEARVHSKEHQAGDPEAVFQGYHLLFKTYCFDPQKVDALNLRQSAQANINGAQTFEILRESVLLKPYNLSKDLDKLKCKTLVLHGDYDVVPVSTAERIHTYIPGSQLKILKDCGHFSYVEKPEEFFQEVSSFLK